MMHTQPIVLDRARDQVRSLLRDLILTGGLPAESRIEEVDISTRLGVSRTPVREALIALELEGLVRSRPRKGYVVVRADADLVREAFPIIGALEAAAVQLGSPGLKAAVPRLRALNQRLSRETSKRRQYELDHAFHALLTEACSNQRLLSLLEVERTRARLFDGAYRRGTADRSGSCAEHEKIIQAIERGDHDSAARKLREHWERGVGVVTRWLATT